MSDKRVSLVVLYKSAYIAPKIPSGRFSLASANVLRLGTVVSPKYLNFLDSAVIAISYFTQ